MLMIPSLRAAGPFCGWLLRASYVLCTVLLTLDGFAQTHGASWVKTGGSNSGYSRAREMATDGQGNIYLGVEFSGAFDADPGIGTHILTPLGNFDVCVIKLDSAHNFVWARQIGGGTADVIIEDLATDSTGNVYLLGGTLGVLVDYDPGPGTVLNTVLGSGHMDYLIKLGSDGVFQWALDPLTQGNDRLTGLAFDALDHMYVIGGSYQTASSDAYLYQYDVSGNILWSETWAENAMGATVAYGDIAIGPGNTIYLAGSVNGPYDFDLSGNVLMIGDTLAPAALLARLDTSAHPIWVGVLEPVAALGTSGANNVAVNALGEAVISGGVHNSVDLDPTSGVNMYTSAGSSDTYVASFGSMGQFLWSRAQGGTGAEYSLALEIDAFGGVYTSTAFTAAINLEPDSTNLTIPNSGDFDAVLQHFSPSGTLLWHKVLATSEREYCHDYLLLNDALYACGQFGDSLDFGSAAAPLVALADTANLFLARFSTCSGTTFAAINDTACGALDLGSGNFAQASGQYVIHGVNSAGCDSLTAVDLVVLAQDSDFYAATTCEMYYWPLFDTTLHTSGVHVVPLAGADVCPAQQVLNLTIDSVFRDTLFVESCTPYYWDMTWLTYSNSGQHSITFNSQSGCDSSITLDLLILPPITDTLTAVSCSSYFWNESGNTYHSSGYYGVALQTPQGCDSLITLSLTIDTLEAATTIQDSLLTASVSDAIYQWINCGDLSLITNATNQSFQVTENGDYAVIVTQGSCTDTSSCTEVLVGSSHVFNAIETGSISMYPNPASSTIAINTTQPVGASYAMIITSVTGQVLYSKRSAKSMERIDVSGFSSGLYSVYIWADGKTYTNRFLVTRDL